MESSLFPNFYLSYYEVNELLSYTMQPEDETSLLQLNINKHSYIPLNDTAIFTDDFHPHGDWSGIILLYLHRQCCGTSVDMQD